MFDPALRGHQGQRRRLLERLKAGRLQGSLLFTGPEGVGKRRVALELAQRELCLRACACGTCPGCAPFRTDPLPQVLPNLLRIAPEGKAGLIRIGAIREDDLVEGGVIRWATQTPPPRCNLWVLIEDAHRLGSASANMLLKTLEEPPPTTHFLLVTHRPESVLATIRSRCERISFGPLDPGEAWEVAKEQGWAEGDREAWTALSGGTLRYLDPEAFERARAQVEAWLDLLEGAPLAGLGALMPERDASVAQSQQMFQCLELLLLLLGDLGRLRQGHAPRLGPWAGRLQALVPGPLGLKGPQEAVSRALQNLGRNPGAEGLLRDLALELQVRA